MQIQVTKNKVILPDNYIVNKGEYHVNVLEFLFSEEYTNEMVKKAIFVSKDESIEQVIINNQCHIPNEMLNIKNFELRVYAYEIENEELVLRYSPTYAVVYLREGSYKSDTSSEETITPTQFEQFEQALNNGLNELETGLEEVSNVDIDASKSGNTATVTITDRQGTEKSVEIFDGDDYVITENDYQEIANIIVQENNFLTSETDPTVPSYVKNITQNDIVSWNNKSNFSGSYDDLTDKPTIPSEVTETTVTNWGFTKNVGTITGINMNGTSKGTSGVIDLGTVITSHQDISGKEDASNKVTSLSNSSTDTQYPSAKCVYDLVGNIESLLQEI